MAKMIPAFGPQETGSQGERTVYAILSASLADDFTVIHSLPWLSAAVRTIDPGLAPTGEVDFIVLHPELGLLVIEVKGGHYRIDGTLFVLTSVNKPVNVVGQTRRNFHGLAQWLGGSVGYFQRMGYAYIFPDSHFGDAHVSAAVTDVTVSPPTRILIDRSQMPDLAQRVVEIMRYWRDTHRNPPLGPERMGSIVRALCPQYDGTSSWASRIVYDGKAWLRMTAEQSDLVDKVLRQSRTVASGWPGTGKTLVAIEAGRRLDADKQRVLFITFNARLAEHLQFQLHGTGCTVSTWHKLCNDARRRLNLPADQPEGWFKDGCCEDLDAAISQGLMQNFDALIIDEAQAMQPGWCRKLADWFSGKKIMAFCDESQIFAFEHGTDPKGLCSLFNAAEPFFLTVVMRMPKAVTDRLRSVRSTNYQLSSPRQAEPDTIRELLQVDFWPVLLGQIQGFKAEGVEATDICVLLPSEPSIEEMEAMSALGVGCESVARFRGLESPVVIIPFAASLDDSQLFCAYSRATTVCVALYNTERVASGGIGAFRQTLLMDDANRALIESARIAAKTRTILAGDMEAGSIALKSIDLAWSHRWHAWMAHFESLNSPSILWVDYLLVNTSWPVYYWHEDSRRAVIQGNFQQDGEPYIQSSGLMDLVHCDQCDGFAPRVSLKDNCAICAVSNDVCSEPPSEELVAKLVELDRIISSSSQRAVLTKEARRELPVSIAAIGARIHAYANSKDRRPLDAGIPPGKLLYRTVLAFAQARISLLSPGAPITIDVLTDSLRERYEEMERLDRTALRGVVANALGTCFQKKLIVRSHEAAKGSYCSAPQI